MDRSENGDGEIKRILSEQSNIEKRGIAKLSRRNWQNRWMNTYKRHRFPPDIISYAVWLYFRFNLSHRDIESLPTERGITVTRESIRLWCIKLGAIYTRRLKRKYLGYGDTIFIDEVFIDVPDHSDQRQAALSLESGGPGWRSG